MFFREKSGERAFGNWTLAHHYSLTLPLNYPVSCAICRDLPCEKLSAQIDGLTTDVL